METSVNNKCKAFTSLEQSKKLAEILPPESADMYYPNRIGVDNYPLPIEWKNGLPLLSQEIPCWSLTALLSVLPLPQLSEDKLGSGKVGWMVSAYPNGCRYDSEWHDNPVGACVEIVLKLYEQKNL